MTPDKALEVGMLHLAVPHVAATYTDAEKMEAATTLAALRVFVGAARAYIEGDEGRGCKDRYDAMVAAYAALAPEGGQT